MSPFSFHLLTPPIVGWDGNMILMVDIPYSEEIPPSACIEGYGSFEV
jgi:hypothetical protein